MTEPGVDATALLRRARRGLSPSAADAARVRSAVGVSLVTAGTAGAIHATASASHTLGANGVVSGVASVTKLGFAVLALTGAGIGGYALGYDAGKAHESAFVSVPTVIVAVTPSAASPKGPPASVAVEPAPAPRGDLAPKPELPSAATLPAESAAAATPESPLEIETRLLERVERALRDKNARFALGLLNQLDREVPGGQLREERQAGRVMAHCAIDSDSAGKQVRDFVARYPTSGYRSRIEQACVPFTKK